MAEIKAFKALRFSEKAGNLKGLTCPPYDIISEDKRKEFLRENPYNIIRLELPKDELDGKNQYEVASQTLNSWIRDGVLLQDEHESLYVYEIEFVIDDHHELSGVAAGQRSIIGLIGLLKIEDYESGVVIPHEETLSKAKTDRLNLMRSTHCNFSNIYTLYKNEEKSEALNLEKLVFGKSPLCQMTDDAGLVHRLWAISDKNIIDNITGALKPKEFYIADGHHRYEVALNFRNYCRENGSAVGAGTDYVMNMMVDMSHPGLVVFPTHRLLHGVENFNEQNLIEQCGAYFYIENDVALEKVEGKLTQAYNEGKHCFALYTGKNSAAVMVLKDIALMDKYLPDKSAASKSLDVAILHSIILENILGIDKEDLANQKYLTYTRSLPEAVSEVDSRRFQCSFILNPTRVSEIGEVAAAGEKMPQKSTYFYPKLITGLTVNKLD